jgi:hypothetical protein
VLANEWIGVINANGGSLPEVDLGPVLGVTAGGAGVSGGGVRAQNGGEGLAFTLEAYEQLLATFPRLDQQP